MNGALTEAVGLKVSKFVRVHDYVQLLFGENISITIFNDFMTNVGDMSLLEGRCLLEVEESAEQLVFYFSEAARLTVDLSDQAYHGPEAVAMHRKGKPTIVWN